MRPQWLPAWVLGMNSARSVRSATASFVPALRGTGGKGTRVGRWTQRLRGAAIPTKQPSRGAPMARDAKDSAASRGEAALQRIRDLNESILERAREAGKNSLDAYERLLKSVADYQKTAGERSG